MKSGILICVAAMLLVACSPTAEPIAPPTATTSAQAAANPTDVPPTDVPATDVPPTDAPAAAASASLPAWASLELVDVNTRETFSLADFEGKTIYVHMMATWCTNCLRSQEGLAADVIPQFGDEVVFVSLDVQTQLTADRLAEYTARNEFDWTFAVTTNDFMNAITAEFGRTAANPPSTPHFVIYPDGTVTQLLTGVESPDNKIALIRGA